MTGEEGDISNLFQYTCYDWCYYKEEREKFTFNREILGRVFGPDAGAVNEMSQWVIKANGNVVPRQSTRLLHVDELNSKTEEKKRKTFDALIERRWGTSITPPNVSNSPEDKPWKEYHDDDE